MSTFEISLLGVFLDYDGTLTAIVNDSDKAYMSIEVKSFVNLKRISYAGSHGVDILIPACLRADKEKIDLAFQAAARDVLDDMKKVFNSLREAVQNIKMAKVEDNSYSEHGTVENLTRMVVEKYPNFRVDSGNMVWEVKGPSGNKGDAIEFLMEHVVGLKGGNSTPIFIGGDTTDEPGFRVVNRLGGISIIVSKVSKDTNAKYWLPNQNAVRQFLSDL